MQSGPEVLDGLRFTQGDRYLLYAAQGSQSIACLVAKQFLQVVWPVRR